jgi:aspartyl-tRNA(Asn)/glutamyl-tRNA(Gln) amidotransferase subunit A
VSVDLREHPHSPPDAHRLRSSILAGERTVSEVLEESLERIAAQDERLGCFLVVDAEQARARARQLERDREEGAVPGALFGVPIALKSNMCLQGVESNCGSRILAGYRAPYSATFVQRLIDAGAIPVGMTNMDEFAMGSSGENSAFRPTRNPWDETRTPGGSSSGSAAAVCASMVPIALGSDTGGSVRLPAALCGVCGFKPTYGRVSRYGLIAFASSLDQVGILARSVRDIELCLSAISGGDDRDSTCLPLPPVQPELDPSLQTLEGMRIGVPAEFFPPELDASVRSCVERALEGLARLGAECVPVSLPRAAVAIATYYVIATAEASANLARYDGVRYGLREGGELGLQDMFASTRAAGFGREIKRRILLGTYVLQAGYRDQWYSQALKVRRVLHADFEEVFAQVDLLAGPTSPVPAFPLGERVGDPLAMYLADTLTTPASLAGLPALSVPCGFLEQAGRRLPVGLQLIGPPLSDARVLRGGRLFQEGNELPLPDPDRPGDRARDRASGAERERVQP